MTPSRIVRRLLVPLALLPLAAALAQRPAELAGHWEGEIAIPGSPLAIRVDLAFEAGAWSGTIDIPAQGAKGLPLIDVEIAAGESGPGVGFAIQGVPGAPTFAGRLEQDGAIRGTFTQAGARLGFHLTRETAAAPARPQEPTARCAWPAR